MNDTSALAGIDRQEEAAESGPLAVALGFFIVPLLLVMGGVGVFLLFGLIAHEDKSVDEYLAEVTGGGINEPWQGAFGLANKLQQDSSLQGSANTATRIADALEHRNASDPQVRKFLLLALGRVAHASSVPAIEGYLADEVGDVRLNALWALGNIGPPDATPAAPAIAGLLNDDDIGVRTYAAYVLGTLDHRGVVEPLRVTLNDPATQVRWNAAVALARLGDDSGLEQLRQMIDRDRVTAVQDLNPQQEQDAMLAAIQGLVSLQATDLRGDLEELRDNDPDSMVREAARQALATMVESQRNH